MTKRLDWNRDGASWPNREHSRFVNAGGLRWHVQSLGTGPALLLLHGTGASTHSFRDLAPLLAKHFTVVMPDLPGHGFTGDAGFGMLSLDGMALVLGELLEVLDVKPVAAVGHSAGAALLLRMDIDTQISPTVIVSLNGALQPFPGLAGQVFAPIARMLALLPIVPGLFAWRASDPNVVDNLLKRTGSQLDPEGVAQYRLLAKNAAHVGAALGMMANWDLPSLKRDLPKVRARVLLIAGALDEMVPPSDAVTSRDEIAGSRLIRLKGLGHLAHEEQPGLIARLIEDAVHGDVVRLSPSEGRDLGESAKLVPHAAATGGSATASNPAQAMATGEPR